MIFIGSYKLLVDDIKLSMIFIGLYKLLVVNTKFYGILLITSVIKSIYFDACLIYFRYKIEFKKLKISNWIQSNIWKYRIGLDSNSDWFEYGLKNLKSNFCSD